MSAAVPAARNALRMFEAADEAMLPRAPSRCVAATVRAGGAVTIGGVVSTTVTVNEAVALLACASVATQVVVVTPRGKIDPLDRVQLTATLPSTTSVADVWNVNAAPPGLVASSIAPTGLVNTGAVVSTMCTSK